MRIQLAQVNPVTGDIEGNVEKVRSCLREAGGMGVDLTIFPECMISGFPAGGLLECPEFLRQCEEAVNNLARQIKGIAVIIVNVQGLRMALGLGGSLMERGLDVQDAEEGLRDVEMEVDISAQMYHLGEGTERERAITEAARSMGLSLIHISEPTRRTPISYAVFCLKKKKKKKQQNK